MHWFFWTLAVAFGRVVYLMWKHDFRISMIWFVKLVTDPFTDIVLPISSPISRAGSQRGQSNSTFHGRSSAK
jgi:hypothetical protein